MPSAGGPAPTQAAHGPAPPVAEDPQKDIHATTEQAQPIEQLNTPAGQAPVEEKVEYRDEEGNILNDEQVAALQGKVSFSTRYETRTRLVDQMGNEIEDGLLEGEDEGAAKPQGVDPATAGRDNGEGEANTAPASNVAGEDVKKEQQIQNAEATPEPESDAGKATKDEL